MALSQETFNAAYGQPSWQAPATAGLTFFQALKQAQQSKLQQDLLKAQTQEAQAKAAKLMPRADGTPGAPDSETAFKYENTLRDEFSQKSKEFATQATAFNRIRKSAQNPSAAGDLALIFNYMKMLDPGSTVREGEFANAQNAAGIPDQIRNAYNRARTGERLNPNQRQDFLQTSARVFGGAIENQKQLRQAYSELASRYAVSPENVLIPFTDPSYFQDGGFDAEKMFPALQGAVPRPQGAGSKVLRTKTGVSFQEEP